MSATNLGKVNKIIDPTNPNNYWEIEDKYAREQVVLKLQKTMVNSLPAKPTTYEDWIAMQPFLYYLPITGQDNEYEVWTLFFMGDPTVASDYTDTSNYEWAKCGKTDVDLSNFSTKGHTHEVVTDVAVEDHDYTPQGQVVSQFEGASGESTGENTHKHTYTPQGSVDSSFSGTQGQTQNGTTGITPSKTKKALKKKAIKIESAGVTITPSTANRATGDLEALNAYDASKAVFNNISVSDGALSFGIKKMSTAQTMTGASGSTDASKVTLGGNTTTEESLATGDLEDNAQAANQVMTDVTLNDPGHKHNFTPAGTVSSSFSGTQGETSEVTHSHDFQAHGSVMSSFRGLRANLKHRVDNRRIITSPDQEDPSSHVFDWYGIRFNEAETNPVKTRVGNMDMHRMLPIQTKMRRCLLNDDGTVNYYLDDNDSTKRAGSQEGYVTSEETFMSKVETDEIRDETEEIGVINGNTCELNQLVENGNFSNGTAGWIFDGTGSVSSGVATVTGSDYIGIFKTFNVISGHKYYYCAEVNLSQESDFIAYFGSTVRKNIISETLTANTWHSEKAIVLVNNQPDSYLQQGSFSANTIQFRNIQVFDLTLMGIDSFTTVEQVEAYLAQNFGQRSYYPFNAGTLLSNTMKGIQTVGFNKWDEEWEVGQVDPTTGQNVSGSTTIRSKNYISCFPSTTYYIKCPINILIVTYDSQKNCNGWIVYGGLNTAFTTPTNAAYMRFSLYNNYGTTYNHDICINISDPKRNGTYEPYNLHPYQSDVTQITGINPNTGVREVVFPDGMKKTHTGLDVLYNENGVSKARVEVDSVDLGDLNFGYDNGGYFQASFNDITPVTTSEVCDFLCSKKYIVSSVWYTTQNDGYIGSYTSGTSGYIRVKDDSYGSSISNFMKGIEGTTLIYKKKTPILYTDLQWGDGSPVILPIEIEAEKNSTIKIVPPHDDDDEELLMAAPTLQMKKYVLTQGANLDGSDGQVMVEIPEHWRRVRTYLDGANTMVDAAVSPYPQETSGWIHIKKGYISAYEASIIAGKLCSVSDIVNLTLAIQNGKIVATCDVSTATGQSDITSQLPTTNVTMDAFRTAARARALDGGAEWNQLVYEQYLAVVWLYWIEYANLNSQAAFTNAKTVEGFMQGGLGNGVSTISSGNWNSFNGYRPFVPCGITNCLGNHSGEVYLTLPSGLGGGTVAVPSYRGIENFFGHIWKFADGIKYLGDGSKQSILRCNNPADYSSASASAGYTSIGDNYGGDGWKTKIMIGDDGDINCKAVGGSSNLAYCDYNYQAHAAGTYYCCLLGGAARYGSADGVAYVSSDFGVSFPDPYVGSRLCYFEADI